MKIKYFDVVKMEEVVEVVDSNQIDIQSFCKEIYNGVSQKTDNIDHHKIWVEVNDEFVLIGI